MGRYLFLENNDTYCGWLLKVWVIFTSSQKTYKYIVIILKQFLQMKICLILGSWLHFNHSKAGVVISF